MTTRDDGSGAGPRDGSTVHRDAWTLRTRAVASGRPQGAGAPLNEPLVLASNFRDGPEYARTHGTATWTALEDAIGELESGRCVAFSSGMAAANAIVFALQPRTVLVPRTSYLGVRALLGELETRNHLVVKILGESKNADLSVECMDAIESGPAGTILWLESPANPTLEEVDVAALCTAARNRGVPTVVDSTFATPMGQLPLRFGASVVLHSGTKFIGGHSDLLIGLAISDDDSIVQGLTTARTLQGATPGALESFLALRGLRTLPLRYRASSESADALAQHLRVHPAVEWVRCVGPMVSFVVRGGAEAADEVCRRVDLIVPATSLGGVETTIERRQKYAGDAHVEPGLLRMSVGLEDVVDLWRDLRSALES